MYDKWDALTEEEWKKNSVLHYIDFLAWMKDRYHMEKGLDGSPVEVLVFLEGLGDSQFEIVGGRRDIVMHDNHRSYSIGSHDDGFLQALSEEEAVRSVIEGGDYESTPNLKISLNSRYWVRDDLITLRLGNVLRQKTLESLDVEIERMRKPGPFKGEGFITFKGYESTFWYSQIDHALGIKLQDRVIELIDRNPTVGNALVTVAYKKV